MLESQTRVSSRNLAGVRGIASRKICEGGGGGGGNSSPLNGWKCIRNFTKFNVSMSVSSVGMGAASKDQVAQKCVC